jgi:hypothetical protein
MQAWRRLATPHAESATLGLSLAVALAVAVGSPETYGDGVDPRSVLHLPEFATVSIPSLLASRPTPVAAPVASQIAAPARVEAPALVRPLSSASLPKPVATPRPAAPARPAPSAPAAPPSDDAPVTSPTAADWGRDPWAGRAAPAPARPADPAPAAASPWERERAARLGTASP